LDLGVGSQAFAGLVDLGFGLEQKGLDVTFGEAAVEVKEGAVLWSLGMAAALGLATFEEAFEQGSMEQIRGQVKAAQKMGFALAKRQGGSAVEAAYPTHIY